VQLSSRSDEELVTLARRGWPAPFAVLLHRHGATVRAAVAGGSDPDAAVVRTFSRAMQHLRRVDPAAPVESWLLALAPGRHGRTAAPEDPGPALEGPHLDALWSQLAPRWPRGRTPRRRLPTWLRWSLLTLVLVALAVVIPYATITTGQRGTAPETGTEPLRAALVEPDAGPDRGTDAADGGTTDETAGEDGGTAGEADGGTTDETAGEDGGTAGEADGGTIDETADAADATDDDLTDATDDDAPDGTVGGGPAGTAPEEDAP
jgi:hypothetical protein